MTRSNDASGTKSALPVLTEVGAVPSLDFLREVVSPDIQSVTAEMFKASATPARLYRLAVRYRAGQADPRVSRPVTLILKRIAPDWQDDPRGHEREVNFFRQVSPHLGIAHPRIY